MRVHRRRTRLRMKCSVLFSPLAAVALALAGPAGAGVQRLVRRGRKAGRPSSAAARRSRGAVEQLLAGPTPAERGRGLRSAVPRATPLLSVTVSRRVVTVDLGARFAAGRDEAALQGRVGQLVRTRQGHPRRPGRAGADRGRRPRRASSRATTSAGPSRAAVEPTQRAADDARAPAAARRSRLHGAVGADRARSTRRPRPRCSASRNGRASRGTGRSAQATIAALRAGDAARAARAGPRPADRGAAATPARAPDRGQPGRPHSAHLVRRGRARRRPGRSGSTARSGTRGRCRSRSGCRGRATSPAASRSTSSARCRRTPPRTAASRVNHYDAAMLFGFAETGTPVDVFDEAARHDAALGERRARGRPRRRRRRSSAAPSSPAAVLVALGLPADSRADDPPPAPVVQPRPTELVVALGLGDPVLQAGVVRDGEVILARGLEVDIARDLARRLGIPRVRFVYVRPASRLLAAKVRPWHLVIASIRPTRAASSLADLSEPYLGTDQAVVLRRGLPRLTALGDLRGRITCAVRGSDGARAIAASVMPVVRPILAPSSERLLQLVQTGVCDAAVVDARRRRPPRRRSGRSARPGHGAGRVRRRLRRRASPAAARSPSPRSAGRSGGCGPTGRCTDWRGPGSGSTRRGCGRFAEPRQASSAATTTKLLLPSRSP